MGPAQHSWASRLRLLQPLSGPLGRKLGVVCDPVCLYTAPVCERGAFLSWLIVVAFSPQSHTRVEGEGLSTGRSGPTWPHSEGGHVRNRSEIPVGRVLGSCCYSRTAGRLLLWSPHMEGAGGGLEHPSTHHSRSCLGSGLNQGASGLLVGF